MRRRFLRFPWRLPAAAPDHDPRGRDQDSRASWPSPSPARRHWPTLRREQPPK